ncbi:MAG: hypothetical protein VR72_03235 [Clostridiaceae bacterium BRH_c20a]|nr:MAG: hypothetical protein VR72_03235 [Clostridiaceae bacterium BRH_c20a]
MKKYSLLLVLIFVVSILSSGIVQAENKISVESENNAIAIDESKIIKSNKLIEQQNIKTGETKIVKYEDIKEQIYANKSSGSDSSTPISIQGTVSISGTATGDTKVYGPYQADAGDTIVLTISWTPDTETLFLGIDKADQPIYIMDGFTNGSATLRRNITESGDYIVMIASDGSSVDYSGYITYP